MFRRFVSHSIIPCVSEKYLRAGSVEYVIKLRTRDDHRGCDATRESRLDARCVSGGVG
jgi:hypothetical protein